jgi:hypothetical protein
MELILMFRSIAIIEKTNIVFVLSRKTVVKDIGCTRTVERQGEARFQALIFALSVLQTGHLEVTQ